MVKDAKLALVLDDFVILTVDLTDHLEVALELGLILKQLLQVDIGIAVVGHGPCEDDLQVESARCLAVEVEVAGNGLLLLVEREILEVLLKAKHVALAAVHGLDIAVDLPLHLLANEVAYLLSLDRISVLRFEVILRYLHIIFSFSTKVWIIFLTTKYRARFLLFFTFSPYYIY